jgi:hypothetical protein
MKLLTTILAIALTSSLSAEQIIAQFNEKNIQSIERLAKGSSVEISGYFGIMYGATLEGRGKDGIPGKDDKLLHAHINETFRYISSTDPLINVIQLQDILAINVTESHRVLIAIESREERKNALGSLIAITDLAARDGLKLSDINITVHATYSGFVEEINAVVLKGELIIRATPRIN